MITRRLWLKQFLKGKQLSSLFYFFRIAIWSQYCACKTHTDTLKDLSNNMCVTRWNISFKRRKSRKTCNGKCRMITRRLWLKQFLKGIKKLSYNILFPLVEICSQYCACKTHTDTLKDLKTCVLIVETEFFHVLLLSLNFKNKSTKMKLLPFTALERFNILQN